jgi:hypothetical protein
MADKTAGVDWLDNLEKELLQQSTNVAPDRVGVQPTDMMPLGSSDLVDMMIELPPDDKVAIKYHRFDNQEWFACCWKKVDSDVEEVNPDHGSVKRKLNFTDLTKIDSPAVGKKADSDVEEVDPDHVSVKRKLNFTDLTKSDSPAVGKKADSDVEELHSNHEKESDD